MSIEEQYRQFRRVQRWWYYQSAETILRDMWLYASYVA